MKLLVLFAALCIFTLQDSLTSPPTLNSETNTVSGNNKVNLDTNTNLRIESNKD